MGCEKRKREEKSWSFWRRFFLIPKNVASERWIALMPTLIRWWEALRAPADGRNGGAQQTVWRILMEMERFDGKGNGTRSRSLGLGSEPGEGLRAGQSSCGVGLGDALQLPKEDLASAVRVFLSIRGECSSKDVLRSCSRP